MKLNVEMKRLNLGVIMLIMMLTMLMVICNINDVSGLGVTPGRTSIEYNEGFEKTYSFSVLNNERKNMQVMLMVQGELNDSITLYDSVVDFLPSEESKSFNFTVKLDDNIKDSPGSHMAEIIALEVPKADKSGSYVGSTVAVVSQVHVFVACPGKCVIAEMHVFDAEKDSTATFVLPVINKGKVGINNARALIDIYYPNNEKITQIETDIQSIEPGKRIELSGKWDVDVPEGNYIAKASILYDGETYEVEKTFSVGEKKLTIENVFVNNFRLGEISKLQVLVENHWNQEIRDVFANMIVYNSEDQVMVDIRSSSEDLLPLSKKELVLYWDTYGVEIGEYNANLLVRYDDKSADRNLVLKVNEDSLDVFGVGYTIRPEGTKGLDLTFILIVLVVLMLLVNVIWFVMFKKLMSARTKKK